MYFQYYDLATQNHSHFFEIEILDGLFNSNIRFYLEFFSSLTSPIIFAIKNVSDEVKIVQYFKIC